MRPILAAIVSPLRAGPTLGAILTLEAILTLGALVMPTRADPLASARWDARPLVVVAPPDDPRIAEQRERIAEAASGFRERDQMLVEARDGDGLRERFRVAPDAFAVILVGKDGTEKARWPEPVDAAEVFALIDAMPMRRREIERGD